MAKLFIHFLFPVGLSEEAVSEDQSELSESRAGTQSENEVSPFLSLDLQLITYWFKQVKNILFQLNFSDIYYVSIYVFRTAL